MKRFLSTVLALLMLLSLFSGISAFAIVREPTYDDVKKLVDMDFEDCVLGEKPEAGQVEGSFSSIAESTSKKNYVRVAAEDGNRYLHLYRSEDSAESAGIRAQKTMDLTGYDTLLVLFKVKSFGAGASVVFRTDAGKTVIYSGAPETWTSVRVELNFKEKTYTLYVEDAQVKSGNIKYGAPESSILQFGPESMTPGTGIAYDDVIVGTKDAHVQIKKKILAGNEQIHWDAVVPEKPLSDASYVRNLKPKHPRIFVRDWEEVIAKIETSHETKMWYANIKAAADNALVTPPLVPEFNGGAETGYITNTSADSARDRLQALAFVYNITKDKKYADRAYEEMLEYSKWPNWAGFQAVLITAEMAQGYACCYDWLYDVLTAEQKQTILDILKDLALPGFLYNYEGAYTWSFATIDINWNPVCNASALMMATAFADEEPNMAEYLFEKAMESIKLCLEPYAPQGAYPEGVSYWDYGTRYLIYAIDLLENAFTDGFEIPKEYRYSEAPGLSETADFPIYYDGPAGRFSYGDCAGGHTNSDTLYWLANQFNKPHYAWWQNDIQQQTGEYLSGYKAMNALVWYNPENAYMTEGDFTLDKFYSTEELKVNGVSVRSSWENKTALFAAMQGGYNDANHQHHSLGTFIVDYMGERFIGFTGGANYSVARSYDHNEIYYMRSEAYNTLVANPSMDYSQNPKALAKVVRHGTSENTAFGIMDLRNVFSNVTYTDAQGNTLPNITKAQRGLMLTDNRSRIVVQDEVEIAQPTDFYWFANTKATITFTQDAKCALLDLNGVKMLARIVSAPQDASFVTMASRSVVEGVAVSTAEVPKLAIYLPKQAENFTIAVEFIPLGAGEGMPATNGLVPLASWSANDNGKTALAEAGSATVLKLNTPNAIANGAKTFVDTTNTDVVPFTENGRTLVPVRFISESFGAKVGWNDTSQAVSVDLKDKHIELVIGSNEMKVNGETVMLDVPANTYNSRTLIPLRALVEALGKHVHWDDRGLIIIADDATPYSAEAVNKMIAALNVRVQADGEDIAFFNTDKTEYTLDLPADGHIPQITASGIGTENVSVEQDAATATVRIDGKAYTFRMQPSAFAGLASNADDGIAVDMKISIGNKKVPDYNTFIYVERLTDSTGFATYPERGAVDGVINDATQNRWAADGDGHWLQFDFGSVQNVHSMAFAGVNQTTRAYYFDVLASVDGVNWETVHTGGASVSPALMSILPLGDVQARYIKIVAHSNSKNSWNTYAEVRFYTSAEQEAEDAFYWDVYFAKDASVRGKVGESGQLYARGVGADAQIFENYNASFTYEVSDESIATVSPDGTITFLAPGKTKVTLIGNQNGMRVMCNTFLTVE